LKASNEEITNINPIKIKYYFKNITATQTNMIAGINTIYGSLEMFEGYRKKNFSEATINFTTK